MIKEAIQFDPKISYTQKRKLLQYSLKVKEIINNLEGADRENQLLFLQEQLKKNYSGNNFLNNVDLIFFKSLLIDLLIQDWKIFINDNKIRLEFSQLTNGDKEFNYDVEKKRTRRKHLLNRNIQLKEPSVTKFIKNIEKPKMTIKGWHSIFSIMRDGDELYKDLIKIRMIADENNKIKLLNSLIQPYIQFVEPDIRCDHTGLYLSDIWRYFRYTWVKEYKCLPGRTISILIRDAGANNHPIIGIAALGSSIAQQTCRDKWIGWDGKKFLETLMNNPSTKFGKWILNTLDKLFKQIYLDDFIEKSIITKTDLDHPSDEKIKELRILSSIYKQKHSANPHQAKFNVDNSKLTWEERAKSNLFKSKRVLYLSEILYMKLILNKCGFIKGTKKELIKCLEMKNFQDVVERMIRKIKSIHLGIDIMDIVVCGALAPYNHLIGGKLVSMLLASPEVLKYHKKKYSNSISLIASSMKGQPVLRKTNLVLLCTTSLYHVGSSQYNRINIPIEEKSGIHKKKIEYKKIGLSEGYGSFHFSSFTLKLAEILVGKNNGNQKVNSIFGEGANPLLRKIKDALLIYKLDPNPILNHRSPRVVYGIKLADNFREVLTEMAGKPKYLLSQTNPNFQTGLIIEHWIKRWLVQRISNNEILDKLKNHNLTYPITHGARVQLPKDDNN